MEILIIPNPPAGRARGRRRVESLARRLEASGHRVDLAFTRAAGDARELAAGRGGQADRIVAAGGDGTINEIVNGLADPGRAPLLPLALGTANMLARVLGVPKAPDALVRRIESGASRRIDLGRVAGRRFGRFVSVLGVGVDAMVTARIDRAASPRLGYRGYARPILAVAARYRAPRLLVSLDDGRPQPCGFVVLGNHRNYGGIFRLAPDARPDDGRLDVCTFADASLSGLLRAVAPALRGSLEKLPGFACRQAQRIRIESDEPVPVQWDGDHRATTPVEIAVEPRALAVLA